MSVRSRLTLACLVIAALSAASADGSMEGRWVLVEQRYGSGEGNLADLEHPVQLDLVRIDGRLEVRIAAGAGIEASYPWPTFLSDAGPLPAEILESGEEVPGGIAAHYRVRPSPTDDLLLEVRERYRLSDDGEALVGTVEVVFAGGEEHRGSFILHRRFERSP